jgi:hypothetical protein
MSLQNPLDLLLVFWWVIALVLVIVCYRLILRLFGVVLIPQSSIGIVNHPACGHVLRVKPSDKSSAE